MDKKTAQKAPTPAKTEPAKAAATTQVATAATPVVEKKTRRSASYLAVVTVEGQTQVVTASRLPELVKQVSDLESKGATFVAGMRGMPLARRAKLTFGAC